MQPNFVRMYNDTFVRDEDFVPLALALDALMLLYTSVRAKHEAMVAGRSLELQGLLHSQHEVDMSMESAETRVLQTLSTDAEPMLQKLLQSKLAEDRALQAYHAEHLCPENFLDDDDDITEFTVGLHILLVGHEKICGNCRQ